MMVLCNAIWGIAYFYLISKDEGSREHKSKYRHTTRCIAVCGCLVSFKIGKCLFGRLFGLNRFSLRFTEANHPRIMTFLNVLTIANIILTLTPIIFVDIYGLIYYRWGS